ncbi:NAD(P)H:quinone oxidoreductase [Fulvimarina endophytica]|uniref:NAD(P)H dehydrogenase (quinone) n=1 Tax=Fulvimarina endophytica TaxID=2293836 RepID=A0A371X0I4_9HYPH|nr:NAD(P)H:quinone oxidoreductase [Fulvimarina endophytica]RFC62722.1 NAD(P)H:quinone oxidoreductase [Fulvimarina endophytica]
MTKVLVLYYSSYGHVEKMAEAVAEGAREAGAEVDIKRVPETAPKEVVEAAGFKTDSSHPVCEVEELANYDAVIVGSPTRFGNMSSQMQSFWDRTGGLWAKGQLIDKVGGAFTSTASQHGGQETTLISIQKVLQHHGLIVVGLPYSYDKLTVMDEVIGGTPYGASTLAGGDGSRQPSEIDLGGARFQGKRIAGIAAKLAN